MEHIKERSFLHFRSIRMPFDDCRIPGDEMPRLSGVKPWVARDLITAVTNGKSLPGMIFSKKIIL